MVAVKKEEAFVNSGGQLIQLLSYYLPVSSGTTDLKTAKASPDRSPWLFLLYLGFSTSSRVAGSH
jgi:hypothetical protein